jgi:hypothetical protein
MSAAYFFISYIPQYESIKKSHSAADNKHDNQIGEVNIGVLTSTNKNSTN